MIEKFFDFLIPLKTKQEKKKLMLGIIKKQCETFNERN